MKHKEIDYYILKKSMGKRTSENDILFFYKLKKQIRRRGEADYSYKSVQEKIGYEVLGPILYGYCQWLHEQVVSSEVDTLLFLSREGKILERAYRKLFEREGERSNQNAREVRIEYVNVSRLSLSKATILECSSWAEFQNRYTTLFRGLSNLGELVKMLDLTISDDDYKVYGLNSEASLDEIAEKEKIFRLIRERGGESLKKQRDLAIRYLKSKGIGMGRTIISDIGWSGTMQILLEELFPTEKFIGCYIAVGDIYKSRRYQKIDRKGFWFEEDDHERWQIVRFTESAFEALFLCNEGTTVGYEVRANKIVPIKRTERSDAGTINAVHNAALDFIEDIGMNIRCKSVSEYCRDIWFFPYINFAIYPNSETIEFFKDVTFINASKEYRLLPEKKAGYYLLHPMNLLSELNLNNCKVIWLYGLLRLPLPYFKMLCFMTGKLGMKSKYEKEYLKTNKGLQAK